MARNDEEKTAGGPENPECPERKDEAPPPSAGNGSETAAASNGSANGSSKAEARIQELEAQLKEKDGRYVYLYAEFENYKKRMTRERADLLKFGWEALARDLLAVIDNLERALAHMPPTTDKTLVDGLHMTLNQFRAVLEKQGVQPVSIDGSFDPNIHEAVGQEESEKPLGYIVREAARGYTMHGRLLRPARVVVSGGTGEKAK